QDCALGLSESDLGDGHHLFAVAARIRLSRRGPGDVIPGIGSVMIWSPIFPGRDRIHEEAVYGRTDHWLFAGRGDRYWGEGPVPEARILRGELLPVEVQVRRDVGVGRQAAEGA